MFGQDVAGMFAPCPTIKHMLGPLEAQPRVKRTLAHRRVQIGMLCEAEGEGMRGARGERGPTSDRVAAFSLVRSSPAAAPLPATLWIAQRHPLEPPCRRGCAARGD